MIASSQRIALAAEFLRQARAELRLAGAPKAADYVARALKSVHGAWQHAERRERSGVQRRIRRAKSRRWRIVTAA